MATVASVSWVHVGAGSPWPLGAAGVAFTPRWQMNLAVWAPDADAVLLCIFDASGQRERQQIALPDCTDGVWHGRIEAEVSADGSAELVYGWRVQGPWVPADGHRFNASKVLLDPWAREVVGAYAGDLAVYRGDDESDPGRPCPRDNAFSALKARWRASHDAAQCTQAGHGHAPSHRVAWSDTVLYECHVRGLTQQHPDIEPHLRGTYAALAHPAMLAHYRRLGITTLSLLPVHARADEARLQALGLSNYWGYSSIAFLAPEPRYAVAPSGSKELAPDPRTQFRNMVDAMHAAGFEIVLDVVFNHTGETDEAGPTLSLRGLANARYYRLQAADRALYENWTGCGNCLDLTQPRVLELVLASLRTWVLELGVDGFRFDLAPVLARGRDGRFDARSAFFGALQADPVLSRVKWIAEPWDIGPHGYQLGAFPPGWTEWNDQFRDGMRDWWLSRHAPAKGSGQEGASRAQFAHRFAASSAQFQHEGRAPSASINFITAHDGFTLRDLVSYQHKHNEANGEANRDGHGHNRGWNCGVEGPSADPAVQARRLTLSRSLLASLLLSQGTPMLLAGDELGHSQHGNNNAYCQDNATTWLDWRGPDADDLSDTVTRLLSLRRRHPALRLARWLTGQGDVRWLDTTGAPLVGDDAWHGPQDALVVELTDPGGDDCCWLVCNAGASDCTVDLPAHGRSAGLRCAFDSACLGGAPETGRQWSAMGSIRCASHSLQVWTGHDLQPQAPML